MADTSWAAASMFLAEGELKRDLRDALPAHGGHVIEARDGRELALQRRCHSRGHGLRARPGERWRSPGRSESPRSARSLTGSIRYAMTPNNRMADMIRVVMIGLRMKGSEICIKRTPAATKSCCGFRVAGLPPNSQRATRNSKIHYLVFVIWDLGFPFAAVPLSLRLLLPGSGSIVRQ